MYCYILVRSLINDTFLIRTIDQKSLHLNLSEVKLSPKSWESHETYNEETNNDIQKKNAFMPERSSSGNLNFIRLMVI